MENHSLPYRDIKIYMAISWSLKPKNRSGPYKNLYPYKRDIKIYMAIE